MFDRVQQVSTTTGTGDYALSGAAPPTYRTFAQAADAYTAKYAGGDFACCYLAILGTVWEIGYGICAVGGTEIQRTNIINTSSEDTSPIDWGAGEKIITLLPNTFTHHGHGGRHEYQGSGGYPSNDDDIMAGFGIGSTWQNGNGQAYICRDNALGAAVWRRVMPGIAEPASDTWSGAPGETEFGAAIYQTDGNVETNGRSELSLLLTVLSGTTFTARGGPVAGRVITTSTTTGLGVALTGSAAGAFVGKGLVVAYATASGLAKSWEFSFTAKVAAGVVSLLGTPVVTPLDGDGGLSAADVNIIISSGNLLVETIGVAATNLTWSVSLSLAEVYS